MNMHIDFNSFFSDVQKTPQYNEFSAPLISIVSLNSKALDIGTGTGKLLQYLMYEKSATCTGIDVSASMLAKAEKKLDGLPIKFLERK